MRRGELLDEAKRIVTTDRNNRYGPPHQDFQRVAGVLTEMGFRDPFGEPIKPHQVAMMLAVLKLSRLVWSPLTMDSWVDLAGYAACGGEAAHLTLPRDANDDAET